MVLSKSRCNFEVEIVTRAESTRVVAGIVQYRDGIQTIRETGFLWAFDEGCKEFMMPADTGEYNYED